MHTVIVIINISCLYDSGCKFPRAPLSHAFQLLQMCFILDMLLRFAALLLLQPNLQVKINTYFICFSLFFLESILIHNTLVVV